VELLVVVAILSLLVTLLMPALGRAKGLTQATLCMTQMSSVSKGANLRATDRESGEGYWRFLNGTLDGPMEGGSGGTPECPGNPAKALIHDQHDSTLVDPDAAGKYLSTGKFFFCPTMRVDFEVHYLPLPIASDPQTMWGTYTWYYKHEIGPPGPGQAYNGIVSKYGSIGPDSDDLVMMDTPVTKQGSTIPYPTAGAPDWPFNTSYWHHNALFDDGSVSRVPGEDVNDIRAWLWGDGLPPAPPPRPKDPYDPYR